MASYETHIAHFMLFLLHSPAAAEVMQELADPDNGRFPKDRRFQVLLESSNQARPSKDAISYFVALSEVERCDAVEQWHASSFNLGWTSLQRVCEKLLEMSMPSMELRSGKDKAKIANSSRVDYLFASKQKTVGEEKIKSYRDAFLNSTATANFPDAQEYFDRAFRIVERAPAKPPRQGRPVLTAKKVQKDSNTLLGREKILADVANELLDQSRTGLVVIHGPGGAGKSLLAEHACKLAQAELEAQHRRTPDAASSDEHIVHYCPVRLCESDVSDAHLRDRFFSSTTLGDGNGGPPKSIDQIKIHWSVSSRNTKPSAIVLIDNYDQVGGTQEDTGTIVQLLSTPRSCRVVITIRDYNADYWERIDPNVRHFEVGAVEDVAGQPCKDTAVRLFVDKLGLVEDHLVISELDGLVELFGLLPGPVCACALALKDQGQSAAKLCGKIDGLKDKLNEMGLTSKDARVTRCKSNNGSDVYGIDQYYGI